MNGWIQRMLAASLLCGLTGVGSAQAEGGRITFSGAVVVPTCAVRAKDVTQMAGNIPYGGTFACGGHPKSADASTYALSVVHLDAATTTSSLLLQYFAGYLASAHFSDARLVTRTYE